MRRGASEGTHVVRLALTGGPCAGKSSALSALVETATEAGFDVYVVPETATTLFNNGCSAADFGRLGSRFVVEFQTSLMTMQLWKERAFTRAAAATGRPSILIMDRGLLDSKGYCAAAEWAAVLAEVGAQTPGVRFDEAYIAYEAYNPYLP